LLPHGFANHDRSIGGQLPRPAGPGGRNAETGAVHRQLVHPFELLERDQARDGGLHPILRHAPFTFAIKEILELPRVDNLYVIDG
jgi:hypothetical protein